jgi:hypothetical protein
MAELGNPFNRGQPVGFPRLPENAAVDRISLVERVVGLDQMGCHSFVPLLTRRRLRAGFFQPFIALYWYYIEIYGR